MSEKARKTRNAYFREYRKKNPQKMLEIQERYWMKKAQQFETDTADEAVNAEHK